MKTFPQLAQSAYRTYCKKFGDVAANGHPHPTWDQLGALNQESWIEAVKQVAAEIAATH